MPDATTRCGLTISTMVRWVHREPGAQYATPRGEGQGEDRGGDALVRVARKGEPTDGKAGPRIADAELTICARACQPPLEAAVDNVPLGRIVVADRKVKLPDGSVLQLNFVRDEPAWILL